MTIQSALVALGFRATRKRSAAYPRRPKGTPLGTRCEVGRDTRPVWGIPRTPHFSYTVGRGML